MEVLNIPYNSKGTFLERKNRFLGIVDIYFPFEKKGEKVHIHDSGRLEEILFPGNEVLLKKAENLNRKTRWDILAGKVKNQLIFINSMYHRDIALWVFKNLKIFKGEIVKIKPEYKYRKSRIDFLIEPDSKKHLVEVKGCTLGIDGIALFPDAPTQRGARHLNELIKAQDDGFSSSVLFLIFVPGTICFSPNGKSDPEFSDIYFLAKRRGVKMLHLKFSYDGEKIKYISKIKDCKLK